MCGCSKNPSHYKWCYHCKAWLPKIGYGTPPPLGGSWAKGDTNGVKDKGGGKGKGIKLLNQLVRGADTKFKDVIPENAEEVLSSVLDNARATREAQVPASKTLMSTEAEIKKRESKIRKYELRQDKILEQIEAWTEVIGQLDNDLRQHLGQLYQAALVGISPCSADVYTAATNMASTLLAPSDSTEERRTMKIWMEIQEIWKLLTRAYMGPSLKKDLVMFRKLSRSFEALNIALKMSSEWEVFSPELIQDALEAGPDHPLFAHFLQPAPSIPEVAQVQRAQQRGAEAADRCSRGAPPRGGGRGAGAAAPPPFQPAPRAAAVAMAEESHSEAETEACTEELDEGNAESQEVLFEPCRDYVMAHPRGHVDYCHIDAEVVSTAGSCRTARLHVGKDGLVIEEEGKHRGKDRVKHHMLMLPSVQIWISEEPGRGTVQTPRVSLRIAGSWPTLGVNLLLPRTTAQSLQGTLLGLVRAVTAGLHLEVHPALPEGLPGRVSCRDAPDAQARGPLLRAGYVLYSSFADVAQMHGRQPGPKSAHADAAEATSEVPSYSLCYAELCGPTRVGDARAYLFSSHVDGEAARLVTIIWPYAEDSNFELIRETENTVLRISSEEQAYVEPGARDSLRRSRAESSRLSASASADVAPWEAPLVDCLTFQSSLEARAWMDLAASVYAEGEAARRLRGRVARHAAATEASIRSELGRPIRLSWSSASTSHSSPRARLPWTRRRCRRESTSRRRATKWRGC
ncbi:unnamed protein product [Prorocentrum cordatum]|uniref:Uncharacterized protein n=1 Tax=Prorocentrum cordatum TaxID=2364126 RepID=A0ABN9SN48_9DINO|nr:unnamed protein product [Polarella glacialis]